MTRNEAIVFPDKEHNEDWISFRDRYNRFIDNLNVNNKEIPYSYLTCIIPPIPTIPIYFP